VACVSGSTSPGEPAYDGPVKVTRSRPTESKSKPAKRIEPVPARAQKKRVAAAPVSPENRAAAPRAASKARSASTAKAAPAKAAPAKAAPAKPAPRRRVKVDVPALLERFGRAIPDPHVELLFENPWQLLIAVILSAQSTDRTVNYVTPELFRRWPTPQALASAAQEEVELVIKSTGFFRNKAKAIRGASQMLIERFGGSVPRTLERLVEVPGVARKTANVVLGAAYGLTTGIVTDTHAMRVAQRLGLTREDAPEKIEADLCRLFPKSHWIALSHQLVLHGRHLCTARAPGCSRCALNELCPSRQAEPEGTWPERGDAEAEDMAERSRGFARPRRTSSDEA
jgi:endonuclease III